MTESKKYVEGTMIQNYEKFHFFIIDAVVCSCTNNQCIRVRPSVSVRLFVHFYYIL